MAPARSRLAVAAAGGWTGPRRIGGLLDDFRIPIEAYICNHEQAEGGAISVQGRQALAYAQFKPRPSATKAPEGWAGYRSNAEPWTRKASRGATRQTLGWTGRPAGSGQANYGTDQHLVRRHYLRVDEQRPPSIALAAGARRR